MKINIKLTEGTRGSQSAKRLAAVLSSKLGYKVLRTLKTSLRRTQLLYGQGMDKIAQYRFFEQQGLSALEYTTDHLVADQWLRDGFVVVGRRLIQASCGKGIIVFNPDMEIQDESNIRCPVYTKYKKKKREFRVHVYKDKVVAIVEKKARSDWTGVRDTHIRNLANGYVFCQNPDNLPAGIEEFAIAAGKVVGSHFKGVDIGYNEKNNDLFIIEVNSAPGMQNSNVEAYANAIIESLN